jgi:DNA-binding NtrC family response regulator
MTESNEGKSTQAGLRVYVVDDDARVARTVAAYLHGAGFGTEVFDDGNACLSRAAEERPDIVITDMQMPAMDGIALTRKVRAAHPETEVIVITAHADKRAAISALRAGAYDFFEKPVDADELVETVKRTARYQKAVQDRDRFAEQLTAVSRREARKWGIEAFIGNSVGIRKTLDDIRLLQRASQTSVLITGESGTGKELVARAIHFGSPRASRPFIPVNCSAIPTELAESTLFGHTKGSFTGATADKKGAFEQADEGTIFLDEIGDMPLDVQIKLLRVLEDGVVVPVGKSSGRRVDVRVVAATNADLQRKLESGDFRLDLFYRLAGYTVELPPLRERKGDLPMLAEHFVKQLSVEMGMSCPALTKEAVAVLEGHAFPGNVRELRNMIEGALIRCGGDPIGPEHLRFLAVPPAPPSARAPSAAPPAVPQSAEAGQLPLNLADAERVLIERALKTADGNMAEAARLLGINRTKLYRKIGAVT